MKKIHFGGPVTIGDQQYAAYTEAEVDDEAAHWLLSLGRHTPADETATAKPATPHGKTPPQRPPLHAPELT